MGVKIDPTVVDEREPAAAPAGRYATGMPAALRGLLDRPLASYYLLLACVGLLVVFGLVMVFSATSVEDYQSASHNAYASVITQAISAAVGLVGFWICQRLPVRTYRGLCRAFLALCIGLIVLTDALDFVSALRTPPGKDPVPVHIGPLSASELWLNIGSFQLQPAELAKLGLVLWAADVLVRKGTKIANWRELVTPLFPVAVVMFALVGYTDFGTMTCLFVLFLGLLWTAGVRKRVFGWLFVAAAVGMTGLIALESYRLQRLTVFLNPSPAKSDGPGYQFFEGLYAIANGGWFGVGLGQGRMKWGRLPEAHNDFIFAVIAEELGVVGCVVLLAIFAVLAYTGLRIARRVEHPYRQLVAAGITCWLIGQAVINVGGVIGIMPITGVPLPFISYGGSALVVTLAAAGILVSFARAEPDASRALHARPPRPWVQLVWAPLPPLPSGGGRSNPTTGTGARAAAGTRTAPRARTATGRRDGARAATAGRGDAGGRGGGRRR